MEEKIEKEANCPWNEFQNIDNPILLEQLMDIRSLSIHKKLSEEQSQILINFALFLAKLSPSSNPLVLEDQSPLQANAPQQILGQFLFLINVDPQNTLSDIDLSHPHLSIKNIQHSFSLNIQTIFNRLEHHFLKHKLTQLQDPEIALHTYIPVELAKALLLETGAINFGIIDVLKTLFVPSPSSPINFEINLFHSLNLLQYSSRLREEFEKMIVPTFPNSSRAVIQASLALSPQQEIGCYETRLTALIALLSHLRQGKDRSCFAVSLAIEMMSSHIGTCLKDFRQLLEEGKLTRRFKGIKRDIPFVKKINDENLHQIIYFNKEGELFDPSTNNQPKSYLWDAPGIIAACQSIGQKDPKEFILSLISQEVDSNGLCQMKIKMLILRICEHNLSHNPSSKATLDSLYTQACFAFSSQTCQPLLKIWENSIANMAEAEEGSMIKSAILESTLDAFFLKLGELNIPPTPLLQRYFLSIQKNLFEGIRLQYDPTTMISKGKKINPTEGGFILFFRNQKVENEHSFKIILEEILTEVKSSLEKTQLNTFEKDQLNEVSNILKPHLHTNKFIGYLLARYHPSNRNPVSNLAYGQPLDFSLLKFTPWRTCVGNDSKAILKIYLETDHPIQADQLHISDAREALSKIIDLCKKMPDEEKIFFHKNPNKLKPLCMIGKHRLPFMAGHPSFANSWQLHYSTQDWIEKFVILPGKQISHSQIDPHTRKQMLHHVKCDIFQRVLKPAHLERAFHLLERIPNKCRIKEFRDFILKISQLVQPSLSQEDFQKLKRMVDTALCRSLDSRLKKQLKQSAVHFADTNWNKGIQDLHFCFAVNPGSGKLEIWEVNANGSHLMSIDQHDWLLNQKWEFLTLPEDLIPDDSKLIDP